MDMDERDPGMPEPVYEQLQDAYEQHRLKHPCNVCGRDGCVVFPFTDEDGDGKLYHRRADCSFGEPCYDLDTCSWCQEVLRHELRSVTPADFGAPPLSG